MVVEEKVALTTPCGDVVYYPSELEELRALRRYAVFMTRSIKNGRAYIVCMHPDGPHFRLGEKSNLTVGFVYENLPWSETKITDSDGTFYYKEAPSLGALGKIR